MTELARLSFDQLLELYFERPEVEAELARRHGATVAVLVVDFAGMASRADARGIGYALALAAAARRALAPVLLGHGGAPVKQGPDTACFVFEDPRRALLAGLDAGLALAALAATRRSAARVDAHLHSPVRGGIGLGFGDALLLPGGDVFGPEASRAFALGEDVAKGREILATEAFLRAAGALPAGVGAFRAPSDREAQAGFPFHVLADYR